MTKTAQTIKTLYDEPDLLELLPEWMTHLETQRRSPGTRRSYRLGVEQFVAWCDEQGLPARLDKRTVQRWTKHLLDRGMEPSTIKVRQLALRRYSLWLVDEGELGTNDLVGLSAPAVDEKLTPALTEADIAALMKAVRVGARNREWRDVRDEAILRLMLETGLRAGEVAGLAVEDVDVQRRVAVVRRGKGRKPRLVGYSPITAEALGRWLRLRRRHRYDELTVPADPEKKDGDRVHPLWLTHLGAMRYSGVYDVIERRAQEAGLDHVHPHVLRHTFAHRWLAAGGSDGGLMSLGGWSDSSMIRRYGKAEAAERARAEHDRLGLEF